MRLRERDDTLDPEVERQLDAIDRALAGRPVDPDLEQLASIAEELRDRRPEPDAGWGDELDARVADGFGRGGAGSSRFGRLGAIGPRRIGPLAGALATLVVAVVVGVSVVGDDGGGQGGSTATISDQAASGSGSEAAESSDASASSASEAAPDVRQSLYKRFGDDSAVDASGAYPALHDVEPLVDGRRAVEIARGTEKRQLERDTQLTLSAKPDEVRSVAGQVVGITRGAGGVVASSQVSEGKRGATATLQLTIPTRNLDSALDQLTELGDVESLNESALDITKTFNSAQQEVRDAEAKRKALLEALANSDTEAEADAIQQQIDDQAKVIEQASERFESVARRSRLADVSVTVVGDPNASDDWTISDALDDTVDVLRTLAGILLVTSAVVIPLGILVALIWIVVAAVRRRRRERALDE